MITEFDLEETIAKYQGIVNPSTNDCVKLAALYTVRNELFPKEKEQPAPAYSFAAAPEQPMNVIEYHGSTDFSKAVDGKDAEKIMAVFDETMTMLQSFMPKMYDIVMKRLNAT